MQYHRGYRAEMILAYGSRCACCGESEAMFLTLDHINGGGNIERREIGCPMSIILRLRRLGWPKENHQLLCWNCNHGERMGGCPHKRQQ